MTDQPIDTSQLQINISTFPGKNVKEALAVRDAFVEELKQHPLEELGLVSIRLVGWHGMEGKDVMVEVRDQDTSFIYELVTPEMVPKILACHLEKRRPVLKWLWGKDSEAFYENQKVLVSELVGEIDPLSIKEYQEHDGYKGLLSYYSQGFDSFLEKVSEAGVCTVSTITSKLLGDSWRKVLHERQHPILVVNAAPPSPHSTAPVLLLEGCPHQVLEGILLAAKTVQAQGVVVYLPVEQPLARERLARAWHSLRIAHILPNSEPYLDMEILSGEPRLLLEDEDLLGAYLYDSLSDTFRRKHPRPSFLFMGLEDVASLPWIARQPATACDPGTRIFRLMGAVERPGFVEVPLSSTLADVINKMGGGCPEGRSPKAILVGGPLGDIFPFNFLGTVFAQMTIRELSGSLPLGTIQVLDEGDCLVSIVRDQVAFLLKHSAGQCPSCQATLGHLETLLTQIIEGEAEAATIEELHACCKTLKNQDACHLSREAANPILTSLIGHFLSEYRMHVDNKHCPARVCPKLLPAPCQLTCPTNIDIPSFVALVAHGRYQEALEVIRQDNPFPWLCGLVCPRPCETACVRAHLDDPLNIRYLKAFVAEWTANHANYAPLQPAPANGHKVAIIGSGPAGLSAAHFLALKGYQVTIFEALPVAGGTPGWGIPAYRLPREILQREIENIIGMGVEIRLNSPVGPGRTINDLLTRDGFEAVFVGVGAQDSIRLPMPGAEAQGVYWALDFLREVSLTGQSPTRGKRVIVIGGGNVAIDVARVSLRVARISLARGATKVTMFSLESPEEMPASQWEVEEAVDEGIEIIHRWGVKEILTQEGKFTGLKMKKVERVFDSKGRFSPTYFEDQVISLEADAVIFAIGQKANLEFLTEEDGVAHTPRGFIQIDPQTLATSRAGVFAGGDAVSGPAIVVAAIAAGKQAALGIDHYLSKSPGPVPIFQAHKRRKVPFLAIPAAEKIANHRVPTQFMEAEERTLDFAPVELGYTEAMAQKEARRCLRCDACIRCGSCETVCRDAMKVHALKFTQISPTERILSDYQHPQERCIACGACALACPTGAMEYLEAPDHREVRLCGTVLNQLRTWRCQACGRTPFVPSRYLSYITDRSDATMGKPVLRRLCPKCAREKQAENLTMPLAYP